MRPPMAIVLAGLLTACASAPRASTSNATLDSLAHSSLRYAQQQARRTVESHAPTEGLPRNTLPDGNWRFVRPRDWTAGFFPGTLWYLYEYTHDEYWRAQAVKWTAPLEEVKNVTSTHDVGFLLMSSFGHQYRLTRDERARDVILQGARSLSTRFNPKVGATRSWDNRRWKFPVIIDNMMNLELLFWSSKHGGAAALRNIAVQHALTTLREHVRADSSTFHVVDFDTATGQAIGHVTAQGYADSSLWSRGQAWGIYGFTMTYRETRDRRFLRAAQGLANHFLAHLPPDRVPYWDLRAPDIPNTERDASAGAIAASGLLELAKYASDTDRARYLSEAEALLISLATNYTTQGTALASVLQHSVSSKPAKTEVDVGLSYADYYFVEALLRYLKR